MKSVWLIVFVLLGLSWAIYFVTHQDTLCQSWWLASEDLCIRYNTVHPR